MTYADTDDVQQRIGDLFTLTTTTKPSTSQVTEWIAQSSARIDGLLTGLGYTTVPATGSNDLLILKDAVANNVALKALHVYYGGRVPTATVESLAGWRDFMSDLRSGMITLIDQDRPGIDHQSGAMGFINLNIDMRKSDLD